MNTPTHSKDIIYRESSALIFLICEKRAYISDTNKNQAA